jgi:hypothetical protein
MASSKKAKNVISRLLLGLFSPSPLRVRIKKFIIAQGVVVVLVLLCRQSLRPLQVQMCPSLRLLLRQTGLMLLLVLLRLLHWYS